MKFKAYQDDIIECMETNYTHYRSYIYATFVKMINAMKVIEPISERILELILENDDLPLLLKYTQYYTFVIYQSHTHYLEYADIHDAVGCLTYLKLLNVLYKAGK